ncbi:MAG: hypothetical protein RLZZ230_29 [Candidatus Parcubacteria bacterium]|jgi:uncharacterized membrane protein YdjX (TVP38/TMEM64 family)
MSFPTAKKETINGLLALAGVLIFFVGATLLSQSYAPELSSMATTDNGLGMLAYVTITAIAIILAPVSTLPLIPLAVAIWGWVITAVLSIIGWTIGSQIAFYLARRYGKKLVQRFISLERFNSFEKRFPPENLFWTVVLLRMTVPVDILSYALGLFSTMSSKAFFFSTLIGVTPFAFIFSYTGSLSLGLQIITLTEVAVLIFIIHYLQKRFKHETE